ncbi:hypothetical protein VTP01DRAFT_2609 [Rhizomucor pusillus]|uniref:uncharacterized protein n=1 Tax=Rhizomucor pusillus TaxID=4840 RepID=UPI0037427BCF
MAYNDSNNDDIPTFKLLLIGNSGVGKSSLLLRFTDDTFLSQDEVSATIGVDFKLSRLEVNGNLYKLTIWDTAGQERFRTLTSSYYRGAQGIILVYDVSNRETFEALSTWWNEVNTYCSSQHVVKMIIGNKVDKESSRVVSYEEGAALAQKWQTLFIECSAKTKVGVKEAFEELVTKIVETPSLWQRRSGSNVQLGSSSSEDNASGGVQGCFC